MSINLLGSDGPVKSFDRVVVRSLHMNCARIAASIFLAHCTICAFGQAPQPVIRYANTVGGSASNVPAAVAAGSDGSIYITGLTESSDFPGVTRLSASHSAQNGDLFVVKLAAPASSTSIPLALVTAAIGGKAAIVLSAVMSNTAAGILNVTLQVPDLIDESC